MIPANINGGAATFQYVGQRAKVRMLSEQQGATGRADDEDDYDDERDDERDDDEFSESYSGDR